MCYRICCILIVGLLTAVTNALGDIVWSGPQYQRAYHDISAIDLDQDGVDDFLYNYVVDEWSYEKYWIEPVDGQVVIDNFSGYSIPFGMPLTAGTIIDTNLNNSDITWEGAEAFLFVYGTELGTPNRGGGFVSGVVDGDTGEPLDERYLGVAFASEGSTHYGWIRMLSGSDPYAPEGRYLYIHGWAWETEADTPIIAGAIPEPSTGILTMIGTLSLLQLARSRQRRRKQMHQPLPSTRNPRTSEEPEKW